MNEKLLKFDKMYSGLASNPFGKKTYIEQVKGKVDESQKIRIVFPDQIESVASSFVQGFFADWIDRYGYGWIKDNIEIKARSKELEDKIYENIL